MKTLAVILLLCSAKLDAKMFSELENVQGVERLYTLVDGYYLRPAKAVQFYRDRGNSEAARAANEALQLQLRARSVYRRDLYIGSLGLGALGCATGVIAWKEELSDGYNQLHYGGLGFVVGASVGAFIGIIVGASQGSALLRKAEAKVSEAAVIWFKGNPPKIRSHLNFDRSALELAWCF